jgi:hypothetical protein
LSAVIDRFEAESVTEKLLCLVGSFILVLNLKTIVVSEVLNQLKMRSLKCIVFDLFPSWNSQVFLTILGFGTHLRRKLVNRFV